MGQKENPWNFKLVDNKLRPIPDSPLIQIALAYNSNQYYAAAVDPATQTNYILYVNLATQGTKFAPQYKDIEDEQEHRVAGIFFQKCGVFEQFYKGGNWVWKRRAHKDIVPPWFMNSGHRATS